MRLYSAKISRALWLVRFSGYRPAPARGFALYPRRVNSLAAKPLGGSTLSARHFEHEDEHVHEHEE
jgi:hypothetical protein